MRRGRFACFLWKQPTEWQSGTTLCLFFCKANVGIVDILIARAVRESTCPLCTVITCRHVLCRDCLAMWLCDCLRANQ